MGVEYYDLTTDPKRGLTKISLESIKNIDTITAAKVEGVYPSKKENDMLSVKMKDDKLELGVSIKLLQDLEIASTCSNLQKDIYKNLVDMMDIRCDAIAVNITGFVKEKE